MDSSIPLTPTSPIRTSESKELKPYHAEIKNRLREMPGLAILDQFMQLKPPQGFEGGVFSIDVLHVLKSGELSGLVETYRTPEEFHSAIEKAPPGRIGSFALVSDLSSEMIEALGSRFNLCPEFFALHLRETQCFREGKFRRPTCLELDVLPSYFRKAPFYCLEICRSYPFPGGLAEVGKTRASKTNTPRGCYKMRELLNITVRERVSIYETQTSNGEFVGIILSDHLLKDEIPQTGIDTLTAYNIKLEDRVGCPDRTKQVSCREEVKWWLQKLKSEERKYLFDNPREPLVIHPLLHVVASTNSWFVDEVGFQLTYLAIPQHDTTSPGETEPCLNSVARYLHTGLCFHLKHLKNNLRVIEAKTGQRGAGSDDILGDIFNIKDDMEALLRRVEHDVKFIGSRQAIEEMRASAARTRRDNFLVKIGTIFVPLSVAAGVLSIPGPWYRFVIWAIFAVVSISAIYFFVSGDESFELPRLVVFSNRQRRGETESEV